VSPSFGHTACCRRPYLVGQPQAQAGGPTATRLDQYYIRGRTRTGCQAGFPQRPTRGTTRSVRSRARVRWSTW